MNMGLYAPDVVRGWSLSAVAGEAHAQGSEYDGEKKTGSGAPPPADAPIMPKPGTPAMTAMLRPVLKMLFHKTDDNLDKLAMPLMGANTMELENDMLTIRGEVKRIVPGQFDTPEDSGFFGHAFYEASSIRKTDGRYCFIYSFENSNELCYAVSDSPDRDFAYGGTIISNGDVGYMGREKRDRTNMTANDHGSLEYINGQWYIFHHRQTHKSTFSRQACAEKVTILPDGSIPQVECTSMGLNPEPLKPEETYPAPVCCVLTNGHMPHATNTALDADIPHIIHEADERFIVDIKDGTTIGYRYFAFAGSVSLGLTCESTAPGVFEIWNESEKVWEIAAGPAGVWTESAAVLSLTGSHPVYLVYREEDAARLKELTFRSIEGA